jgi:DNA-binding NarL/FixJ family response regulator
MQAHRVRVLIVEDFIPFQKMIQLILQELPELQVVGMVDDGLEAVRKAKELRPDLVIMDIGLPKLNGIESARSILQVYPQCIILFLTQESSLDIVRDAFRLGARGYVKKEYAVAELLQAVSAVLDGKQFVSSGISNPSPNLTPPLPRQDLCPDEVCTSGEPSRGVASTCQHELQVYSDEAILLGAAARFVKTAIRNGDPVLLIAGDAVRSSLFRHLQSSDGIDRVTVVQRGRYLSLDAHEMMKLFMVNGMPDPIRFDELIGGLIEAAKAPLADDRKVAVFDECAALLWAEGKTEAAFRVEQLSNKLVDRYAVNILCAYPVTNFHGEADYDEIQELCAKHSAVHSR